MFGYRILGLGGSHPNRGGDSRVTITLTIGSNTSDYNIFSNRGGTYSAGLSDVTLVNNATISSSATGTPALDTGSGWNAADTLTIDNNSIVQGDGGNAGAGGNVNGTSASAGAAGSAAGHAINLQFDTTIDNTGGTISGGGGGGGGGGSSYDSVGKGPDITQNAGGGGGGGFGGGAAGSGGTIGGGSGTAGSAGGAGSVGAAGSGGAGGGSGGAGGAGGGVGAAGSGGASASTNGGATASAGAGGAAGKAVNLNSNSVTWTANGTRNGAIS